MPYEITHENNIMIIKLSGSIEFLKATDFEEELVKIIENMDKGQHPSPILFDFSALEYVDSYGLGVLLRWKQLCNKHKLLFAFTNIKGQVRNQFESAQIAEAFPLYDDYDEAMEFLKDNIR